MTSPVLVIRLNRLSNTPIKFILAFQQSTYCPTNLSLYQCFYNVLNVLMAVFTFSPSYQPYFGSSNLLKVIEGGVLFMACFSLTRFVLNLSLDCSQTKTTTYAFMIWWSLPRILLWFVYTMYTKKSHLTTNTSFQQFHSSYFFWW